MADKQGFQWGAIRFGTAYYPEQWDAALWEDDLRRMLDARIDSVRIGDFSWSIFEPREGEFSFELFDAFLAAAEKAGSVVNAAGLELPKSFVVCADGERQTVYLSQLNSSTLFKRSETEQLSL